MSINAPPIELASLSKNIKFERQRRGLSQRDLAKELGFKGTGTITFWENGQYFPPLDTFIKLCNFFGRTPNQMLYEDLTTIPPDGDDFKPKEALVKEMNVVGASKESESPPPKQEKETTEIQEMRKQMLEMMMKLEKMSV